MRSRKRTERQQLLMKSSFTYPRGKRRSSSKASASDSRDCNIFLSSGGRTTIGRSSVSTEVGLGVSKGFNADLGREVLAFVGIVLGTSREEVV
ncbi:hypothetical protein AVEN_102041-1 [Araneus ventricosus]|uniref:Uncharacterized protein n=1 Tax=Araneus ventricosus TaxID=182803 RepID=A0A4Y2S5H5_ARAVE|nr:hypothetical protein AVEN_102041-1 [Araneus ventricosus]